MNTHILESIDPKVIGGRLAHARKARGFTQQDVANALDVARTTVTAMERGNRRPGPSELVRLARLYGVQVGDLVRPVPEASIDDFAVQFRAARRPSGVDSEPDLDRDIQQFKQMCENYVWLEEVTSSPLPCNYPSEYQVAGLQVEQAAEDVASSERNRLGLGDGPIRDIWGLLESDVGLRIFAPPFQSSKLSGLFAFTEQHGGCIAVNGKHPEERRRWTVCHEYGHFLTDRYRAEITALKEYQRLPVSERFADSFARFFLMPSSGLIHRFHAQQRARENRPATAADVLLLSHRYQVSFQAMIFRLQDLKLVPANAWDRLQEKGFKPSKARELLGLEPNEAKLPAFPLRYQTLAIQAFEREALSEGQLARILQTDNVGAREQVMRFFAETVISDEDDGWIQTAFDLGTELAGTK